MPWDAQTCRFCHKRFVNNTLLWNHLNRYIDRWRIPADGIHDVLQIEQILYFNDQDTKEKYQCPTCSKVIRSRRRFIDHVIYRGHYGDPDPGKKQPTTKRRRQWVLPFSEESVIVQPQAPFPFLRLPYDVRHLIYRLVLLSNTTTFYGTAKLSCPSRKRYYQDIYLQHNPDRNPLALLITNRQIYEEARRVFYTQNTFVFDTGDFLPVFLMDIGRHNAELLRSVHWRTKMHHSGDNQIKFIRPWLDSSSSGRDIWTNELAYTQFLGVITSGLCHLDYY
ncbi:hypothetical protein BO78DRAFT_469855 [Aspergillus sclerotiicarbonarius CBS 121057]|uniref:C2H2-type domain-containing protein n=1 Tax=Aspergillus sclerotiicarbonarius (strain CBS 121057 / IBT 28362) TaxID=1448318 RepID=A0A319EIQ8_ASPSB|nr:hypothetical protein BO78DRAFT_469855 [Aspergillus sclerotiicarbonarius CBS 121057]